MLEIRDLHVSYGAHEALAGVSLSIEAGEIVVILGANGAGKSSLLQAVAAISEGRVSGAVALDGSAIDGMAADRIVDTGIAFVPEGRGIFGDLSVEENLLLGAYSEHARPAQQANLARVYELFPQLLERGRQVSRTMSGGEQQMVAIGRALMSNPRYLLLDEPSLGLSPLLCKELFQTLRLVRDDGIGVLMVEQNARQSLAIADRCYLIENGAVSGGGDARAMLHDPAVQAAYLGGAAAATAAPPPASASAPSSGAAKTYITPGRGVTARVSVPVDEFVARAARSNAPTARPKPTAAINQAPPSPTVAGVNARAPAAGAGDHQRQITALLESFETAATRARLGAAAEPRHSAPPTSAVSPRGARQMPARAPTPALRPAAADGSNGGVQVFQRGADGKLRPRDANADHRSDRSGRAGGKRDSSLQIFRRGADGKLHPVRR